MNISILYMLNKFNFLIFDNFIWFKFQDNAENILQNIKNIEIFKVDVVVFIWKYKHYQQ